MSRLLQTVFWVACPYNGALVTSAAAADLAENRLSACRSSSDAFQTLQAETAKVFIPALGRGTNPAEVARVVLVGEEDNVAKHAWPAGFLEPSGPSWLWKAFHASMAVALMTWQCCVVAASH